MRVEVAVLFCSISSLMEIHNSLGCDGCAINYVYVNSDTHVTEIDIEVAEASG